MVDTGFDSLEVCYHLVQKFRVVAQTTVSSKRPGQSTISTEAKNTCMPLYCIIVWGLVTGTIYVSVYYGKNK